MFWIFKRRFSHKVIVSLDHYNVKIFANEPVEILSADLLDWLAEFKGKYQLVYDEMSGQKSIKFTDKSTATMCRLTFG